MTTLPRPYADEYRRRLALCRLATCEAERAERSAVRLCPEHLAQFEEWAQEHRRTDSGCEMEWIIQHGGGWWDPR